MFRNILKNVIYIIIWNIVYMTLQCRILSHSKCDAPSQLFTPDLQPRHGDSNSSGSSGIMSVLGHFREDPPRTAHLPAVGSQSHPSLPLVSEILRQIQDGHTFFLRQIQDPPFCFYKKTKPSFEKACRIFLTTPLSKACRIFSLASLFHFRCPRIFTRFASLGRVVAIRHRPNSIRHYYPLIIISI